MRMTWSVDTECSSHHLLFYMRVIFKLPVTVNQNLDFIFTIHTDRTGIYVHATVHRLALLTVISVELIAAKKHDPIRERERGCYDMAKQNNNKNRVFESINFVVIYYC